MTETSLHAVLVLVVLLVMVLLVIVLDGPRRKWEKKARAQGKVACRACGHEGGLTLACRPGETRAGSGELRLVCGHCRSPDWNQSAP